MRIRTYRKEIHFSATKLSQIREFLISCGIEGRLLERVHATIRRLLGVPADVYFSFSTELWTKESGNI